MSKKKEKKETPNTPVEPTDVSFPVVGIGASAGGLEALEEFFTHTPNPSGMAFVVIPEGLGVWGKNSSRASRPPAE
ncbi:MAG: chemotaxis protein CheB, partial [Oceanipulchritudo sp.]